MALFFGLSAKSVAPISGALAAVVVSGAFIWHANRPSNIVDTGAPSKAATPLSTPLVANPAIHVPPSPSFDVVRVTPKGDTLVAGRGEPGALVALKDGEKTLAQGKVDANGQFVLLPKALADGAHALTLATSAEKGASLSSKQSVVVNMAQADKGGVVVALAEPGKATRVLSGGPSGALLPSPPSVPPENPASSALVAIQTVEVEKGGAFYVTGLAPKGSDVRVYLNNSLVANAIGDAQGRWSLKILNGVPSGNFNVRADQVAKDGKVVSRAEVPFQNAALAIQGAPVTAAQPASKSDVVVPAIITATVVHGDSLWRISRKMLGQGIRYTTIYAANVKQIRNPKLIYPGQVLVVPKSPS